MASPWSARPLTDIDRFLLLGVLVVVPLGLALGEPLMPARARGLLARLQPAAALLAASSYATDGTIPVALLSAAWPLCAGAGVLALGRCLRAGEIDLRDPRVRCIVAAKLYLLVGAAWFAAARVGLHPLRFGEPLVSLTAIHFHYAGFALATITGVALARRGRQPPGSTELVAGLALAGPPAVALGFLISPMARAVAVAIFALGVIGVALLLLALARRTPRLLPRTLLALAALSVLFTIFLAFAYALGEWLGDGYLSIPRMVIVHGWLNAIGFTVPAMLGLSGLSRPVRPQSPVSRRGVNAPL